MPKRDDKDSISETGNWNVAKEYSHIKIMGPLALVDIYLDIATFGSTDFLEELDDYINRVPLEMVKIRGFNRLIHNLVKVIDNSIFAIKKKEDVTELENFRGRLKRIEAIKPTFFKSKKTQSGIVIDIVEDRYNRVLEEIRKIMREMNTPLNKSHLIFTDSPEFDPIAYKKLIFSAATTRG